MIKIQITKYEARTKEDIDAEIRNWENSRGYRQGMVNLDEIRKDSAVSIMDVMITDEQFEAIRKAVIEKF